MPPSAKFSFVCGQDDYLVGRLGQERYEALAGEATDEFSREIISGFAANVDEVQSAINLFREAVQTMSLFGGKRAVWLKDVNFLADTVTGRAESTLRLVEDLQALLAAVNPADTAVLITAAPVDRRRAFPKWCEKNADFALVGGDSEGGEALAGVALAEAKALGATLEPGALELLLAKVGPNTRLLVEEVRKLASYASHPAEAPSEGAKAGTITEAHVAELTPNAAESDFFETAEAFFSGDLTWTLGGAAAALLRRRRFAAGHHWAAEPQPAPPADPDSARRRRHPDRPARRRRPAAAAAAYGPRFGAALAEKSSYNVFGQNPWYLGKLAGTAKLPSLRRLIDNQQDFVVAFEEIVRRPQEQEEVMREPWRSGGAADPNALG